MEDVVTKQCEPGRRLSQRELARSLQGAAPTGAPGPTGAVCVHTHRRTRTHRHTPVHTDIQTHRHTPVHRDTHRPTCTHTCTHVYIHTQGHTHARTDVHTQTHTCTHVHVLPLQRLHSETPAVSLVAEREGRLPGQVSSSRAALVAFC